MNGTRGEEGAEERARESWATESLPMAVRRELLERELDRMGFRKTRASGSSGHAASESSAAPSSDHPQADTPPGDAGHGD
jgi:hypothetical protein